VGINIFAARVADDADREPKPLVSIPSMVIGIILHDPDPYVFKAIAYH
jgi:hypothetical protein